jgi:hypothetical protein
VKGIRHLAAAFDHTEDLGAASLGVVEALEHKRGGTFRHDEAVAVLGERLRRLLGHLVRGRQRREQREPDQGFRIDRPIGSDTERHIGLTAPDRFDAELDRGCAGCAGRRERDRRALGAEAVGDVLGDRSEQAALVKRTKAARGRGAQNVAIGDGVVAAQLGGDGFAMRPFDLDRCNRQEQRSRKITLGADRRLRDRLFRHHVGEPLGKRGGAERLDGDEIDRAGNGGAQRVGREAADAADAGLAGGELAPVVRNANPERRDDPDTGNSNRSSLGRSPGRSI